MSANTPTLPSLTTEQYEGLKADIRVNGILVPVIRDEQGNTIDGFAREQIAAELKLTDVPCRVVAGLSDEEKRHLALSVNVHRRHLTPEQKRRLIGEELGRTPDISNNWLGEVLGVDGETVLAVRKELELVGAIPVLTELRGRDGKRRKRYRTVAVENRKELKRAEVAPQKLPPEAPVKPLSLDRVEYLARKAEINALRHPASARRPRQGRRAGGRRDCGGRYGGRRLRGRGATGPTA